MPTMQCFTFSFYFVFEKQMSDSEQFSSQITTNQVQHEGHTFGEIPDLKLI